jgi:hypothetical protein
MFLRGGGRSCDSNLLNLEGLHLRSDPETSPSSLWWPDLSFWRVSGNLEASFIRAEILSLTVFKRAQPCLRIHQFGGADLGIRV